MENTNFRERIKAEEPSVLEFSKHFPGAMDINISKAEKVRFDENQKFAEAVMEDLNFLIKNPCSITAEQIRQKAELIRAKLSLPQQKVFDVIAEKLEDTAKFPPTPDAGRFIANYNGIQEKYPDAFPAVGKEDVSFSSLGYPIVTVSQSEMSRIYGPDQNGLTNYMPFQSNVFANDFLRQIIFVNEHPKDSTKEKVIEHEYTHKIYADYIKGAAEPRYESDFEKKIFNEIKEELIAQCTERRWQFRLGHLLRGDTQQNLLDVTDVDRNALNSQMNLLLSIREKTPGEEPIFVTEVAAIVVELVRLFLLESTKFKEAMQAVITSQSFKEIAYNLSGVDSRIIDCKEFVRGFDDANPSSVSKLADKLMLIDSYSLQCSSKDALIDAVKNNNQSKTTGE